MRLTGPQHEKITSALLHAFPTPERLERMVQYKLSKNIYEIGYGDLQNLAFKLVQWAEAKGRVIDLVYGAYQSNPNNLGLQSVAQDFGLAIEPPPQRELQRIIKSENGFLDINIWREKLGLIENQVCRIEIELDNQKFAFGTGALVGPSAVMTNYHVMKYVIEGSERQKAGKRWARPQDVILRFDYKKIPETGYENPGTEFGLDVDDWLIDSSPMSEYDYLLYPSAKLPEITQLDYAVLRIGGEPGNAQIGKHEPGGRKRGWITIPNNEYSFSPGSALIIVQHPRAKPLKMAIETNAVIGLNANKTRAMYKTNTEKGSSGSPCFNINWELVALHHTGDPDFDENHQPEYNQGIPSIAIRKLLRQREKWDDLNN